MEYCFYLVQTSSLLTLDIGQEMLCIFFPSVRFQVFCHSMLCEVAAVSLTWLPVKCEKSNLSLVK